ncbi:MAG TPA: hypothetical protein PLO33_02355 [Kouleothrix sp.]|nr:hypothetical protein [Kouleothrix sp.]HRC74488.1 hypothetical protein [Kouleothrix sp.]
MPQPAMPFGVPRGLEALRLMLEQGWRIETPVLARLSWAQRNTGELSYHIILVRAAQRSLVVIPESAEIRRFLADLNIPVG